MLKIIVLSLLFIFTRNEGNQQTFSIGYDTMKMSLSDTKPVFIKPPEPIRHSRKLLDGETPAPTLEPTFRGSIIIPKLYKSAPKFNIAPPPARKPNYTKQEWDIISSAIGAGSAICCLIICYGGRHAYKRWKEGLAQDIAFEIEMGSKKGQATSEL